MTRDSMRPYVAGGWIAGTAERRQAIDPTRESVVGVCDLAGVDEVDAAVAAARCALESEWGRFGPQERAARLRAFAEALAAKSASTAELVTRENGMPIGLSEAVNGFVPAHLLNTYAEQIESLESEERRGTTIVRREPVGVVAAIAPWNFPQALAMIKMAPALAAGCTVILKPSPETSLDAAAIVEASQEAGLPPGVLNVLPAGREVGAYLVEHPGVDKVAFTGSTAAGQDIGEACGRLLRRTTLELGGRSAAIILEDADLDRFVSALGNTAFQNSGQACISQSRILAPRARYAEIVDAVTAYAEALTVGDPLDRRIECGPMATREHLDRVLAHIDRARTSSARLTTGGGRPAGIDTGYFVEPTVFADVDNSSPLAREEVFGPVLAVIGYDDEQSAIDLANDNPYGLAGSVWTTDDARGLAVARQIRTGTIGVNHYNLDLGAPFGGVKASGIGREGGPEALDSYLEYKSIYLGE